MAKKQTLTWNLSPLLAGDLASEAVKKQEALQAAHRKFVKKWKRRVKLLAEPKVLRQALDDYEKLMGRFGFGGEVWYYYYLRSRLNENDPSLKAEFGRINQLATELSNQIRFFELSICRLPKNAHAKLLVAPELLPYRHFLTRRFAEAKYLLSEPEENIIALKETAAYSKWVELTGGFLAKAEPEVINEAGRKAKMTMEQLFGQMKSSKKPVRDRAAAAMHRLLADHADLAEAEINAVLLNKKVDDELRGFARPDAARQLSDDISTEIIDCLIQEVSRRYSLSRRFYKLKAALLKLPRLEYHERLVEFGGAEKTYRYPEAAEIVQRTFQRLDPEFGQIFNRYQATGQIDVLPRPGKHGGAFCMMYLKTHPTYVLLNHTDKLSDVLTIAHEMGHAINNELIIKSQHALYADTWVATAEVASTFMEDFVLEEILGQLGDEQRLAIQLAKLDQEVATVFRQIACYKFEQALHREFRVKGYLSKAQIGRLFQTEMRAYMGPSVEQSKGSENWWVYWSHIRNFFYVYSYSSGLLISRFLQRQVRADKSYIGKVKQFLATGSSASPAETFLRLGVDMNDPAFWRAGLKEMEALLIDTENLALKLGKISSTK